LDERTTKKIQALKDKGVPILGSERMRRSPS
jgi:biotin operon repressor